MTATIVLTLADPIVAQVDGMSAKAGMTPSAWLSEQIEHAFGSGRTINTTPAPRQSRSSRRRHAARARAEREAARFPITETSTSNA